MEFNSALEFKISSQQNYPPVSVPWREQPAGQDTVSLAEALESRRHLAKKRHQPFLSLVPLLVFAERKRASKENCLLSGRLFSSGYNPLCPLLRHQNISVFIYLYISGHSPHLAEHSRLFFSLKHARAAVNLLAGNELKALQPFFRYRYFYHPRI